MSKLNIPKKKPKSSNSIKYANGGAIGSVIGGGLGLAAGMIPGMQPLTPALMSLGSGLGNAVGNSLDSPPSAQPAGGAAPNYHYGTPRMAKGGKIKAYGSGGDITAPTPDGGRFDTKLNPEEETAYRRWADHYKIDGLDNNYTGYDYDARGAFKAGLAPDERHHLSSQYKKPNHITFSDESIYHGQNGQQGGKWRENSDGSWNFEAGQANLANYGKEKLQDYFNNYEQGNKLVMPKSSLWNMLNKKMANGGSVKQTTINVEGDELEVKNGSLIRDFKTKPPHPQNGIDPAGNVTATTGNIVIPAHMRQKYLNAGVPERRKLEQQVIANANKAEKLEEKTETVDSKQEEQAESQMYRKGGNVVPNRLGRFRASRANDPNLKEGFDYYENGEPVRYNDYNTPTFEDYKAVGNRMLGGVSSSTKPSVQGYSKLRIPEYNRYGATQSKLVTQSESQGVNQVAPLKMQAVNNKFAIPNNKQSLPQMNSLAVPVSTPTTTIAAPTAVNNSFGKLPTTQQSLGQMNPLQITPATSAAQSTTQVAQPTGQMFSQNKSLWTPQHENDYVSFLKQQKEYGNGQKLSPETKTLLRGRYYDNLLSKDGGSEIASEFAKVKGYTPQVTAPASPAPVGNIGGQSATAATQSSMADKPLGYFGDYKDQQGGKWTLDSPVADQSGQSSDTQPEGKKFDAMKYAPYVDNLVNLGVTLATPKIPKPNMIPNVKLDDRYAVEPRLNSIERNKDAAMSTIAGRTNSGSVLRANALQAENNAEAMKQQVYADRNNFQSGIRNQEALANNQVAANNTQLANQYETNRMLRKDDIGKRLSDNAANAALDAQGQNRDKLLAKADVDKVLILSNLWDKGIDSDFRNFYAGMKPEAQAYFLKSKGVKSFDELYAKKTN